METTTMTKRCAHCGQPFEPRPQVPDQAYCSAPDCQRARKRQWQRSKLQSDPDYRINQRAAQQAWSQRNQDYWHNYRDDRPEYAKRIVPPELFYTAQGMPCAAAGKEVSMT